MKRRLDQIRALLGSAVVGTCSLVSTGLGQSSPLVQSPQPPVVPVGLDAYRMWDRLPYQRIGVRTYMRSTYDRQGNNRSADASHFLYQETNDFNVTLDARGPGVLYFVRCNHWHGSPWHYEIDGTDVTVRETATDDPVHARERFQKTTFIPEPLFPNPLTWTWTTTHGADLMWVPIEFQDSLRIAYGRTFYGTGYYIYQQFPLGITHLSRPLKSWTQTPPDSAVLELLRRSGTDVAPTGPGVTKHEGTLKLVPRQWTTLAVLEDGPAMIRALKLTLPRRNAFAFGKARLRVTWDDRWQPSIDAPLDLFFGAGQFDNELKREYLVKGFPVNVRYDESHVYLACYWPMPFFRNARLEIRADESIPDGSVQWEIRTVPFADPINHAAYFHATYTDHPHPVLGRDLTFLDTRAVEGSEVWSGHFVGMSWVFSRAGILTTLEGDPRFFFDDSNTPQGWGTGTEEWGGGGDYWGGQNMTIPLAGHPVGMEKKRAKSERDLVNSAYRFLIADLFPFGRRAVINLEHGGVNQSVEHYSGVVYWYGIDSPTLVLTDELNVCQKRSLEKHHVISPTAQAPYSLVSRYEWGPDGDGTEWGRTDDTEPERHYFPAQEDRVRIMKGTTQFTVTLAPQNLGVLLRRKFDYQYPSQRGRVWVRPAMAEGKAEWQFAGEWYTAGANTCVFSNPNPKKDSGVDRELAPPEHQVITSNRRWREEEFLIARQFTDGRDQLEIKLEFVPNQKELFPGHPFPAESAWSEARYWVYCYRMPEVRLAGDL
jgi:D-arabinan exo alpha-(1,3)/(1,5)-arabinofuranosidase (non-reducing end)